MSWDPDEEDDQTRPKDLYSVVINHEEQYSIWPADREVPRGWKPARFQGTRKDCYEFIEEVWTDMRPDRLRRKLAEMEARIKRDADG